MTGPTDETRGVLAQFEENPKIRFHYQENRGLTRSNNKAIEMSRGEYIIRLDADDYLDENALLVLANVLDRKSEVALVYPDYYVVSEDEELIRLERRSKTYEEDELLDLPSHSACAMIRKSCLVELGGYNENILRQDGYDLWIRLIQKYQVYNVNLPLFYYRRHNGSMSSRMDSLLHTRQQIKRQFVAKLGKERPKVLAIVSTRGASLALRELAGSPVLNTVDAALESRVLDRIVITAESHEVLEYAQGFKGVEVIPRSEELGKANFPIEPTVMHILSELKKRENYVPDAVMLLFVVSPLREARHIQQAIDTLQIFKCDSVISVHEDGGYFYRRGRYGLEPIIQTRKLPIEREVFYIEREVFYKDNDAILLSWTSVISPKSFVGNRVSHILMTPEESFQIKTEFDFWMVEQILKRSLVEQRQQAL